MKKQNNRYRPAATKLSFNAAFGGPDRVVAFVDCQTEGLDPKIHQIIQFSAIKCRYSDYALTEIEKLSLYINPNRALNLAIIRKTGISDEFLIKEKPEKDIFPRIQKFLSDIDVFVGYNEPFEFSFTQAMYERNGCVFTPAYRFDVMQMACDLFTIYTCPGNRTLSTVAKKVGVRIIIPDLHNSQDDVQTLKNTFQALLPSYLEYPDPNDQTGFPIPRIRSSWEWENPKRPLMKRVYFATSCGRLYYEVYDHSFGCDLKEKAYSIDELNMEEFIRNALQDKHMQNYRV